MANGIPDLLSMYRESLSSERQSRMGEMQIALSMMQYEAEQAFREEGRLREDAYKGLAIAQGDLESSMTQDAGMIYTKFKGLFRDRSGELEKFKTGRNYTGKEYGFSESEAADIWNMISLYETEGMRDIAEPIAVKIGRRVSKQYEDWQRTGFDPSLKHKYTSSLEKANVLYSGEDEVSMQLSYEPFVGVDQATEMMVNVDAEKGELMRGDYDIQRDIGVDPMEIGYPVEDGFPVDLDNVSALADEFEIGTPTGLPVVTGADFQESKSEHSRLTQDIFDLSKKIEKQKVILGPTDKQILKLSDDLDRMKQSKLEAKLRMDESYDIAQFESQEEKIADLSSSILLEAGLPETKSNLHAARDRAFDILRAEAESRVTTLFAGQGAWSGIYRGDEPYSLTPSVIPPIPTPYE